MLAKMEILTSLDQFDIIAVQTLFMTFHQVSYSSVNTISMKKSGIQRIKNEFFF